MRPVKQAKGQITQGLVTYNTEFRRTRGVSSQENDVI